MTQGFIEDAQGSDACLHLGLPTSTSTAASPGARATIQRRPFSTHATPRGFHIVSDVTMGPDLPYYPRTQYTRDPPHPTWGAQVDIVDNAPSVEDAGV